MKLEDQCCSLELAKQLKMLGVRQESVFVYQFTNVGQNTKPIYFELRDWAGRNEILGFVAAFTVAELGEMLPNIVVSDFSKEWYRPFSRKHPVGWCCSLMEGNHQYLEHFTADTEADARAKMLIHLIETGVVKP